MMKIQSIADKPWNLSWSLKQTEVEGTMGLELIILK